MNEIRKSYTSGSTVYAQVRKALDLTRYNSGSTGFESYNASHWTNYSIALTETGSTGEYAADFPTAITGEAVYDLIFYHQSGGSPASSDTKIDPGGSIYWDGARELTIVSLDGSLQAIGTGSVTIVSSAPVSQDGFITIFQGDDYLAADNRALDWTTSDATTWPDLLPGTTIAFAAIKANQNEAAGSDLLAATGSIIVATGANKKVRFEFTHTETAALAPGKHGYRYDIEATLAGSGNKITLATGTMTVREDQTI